MSDWIEWKSGLCPVEGDVLVQCRLREAGRGWDMQTRPASTWAWLHVGSDHDIAAYRVVQGADGPAPKPGEWVEWDGGECPVDGDTVVRIRTADGLIGRDVAGAFDWSAVVAYRVVSEQPVSRGGVSAVDTLRKAAGLIEQRGKQRDSETGERSMARTVAAFNAVYGTSLTETQGWHFMELLKMARSSQGDYVADDYDDKVAYAALAAECEASSRGR